MKETPISYLKFCWINFYIVLFILALTFTIGIIVEAEDYNKLFALTPILSMIVLIWGSRRAYNIYIKYPYIS